ncbi:MAG: homocysteine S-methyltransferase family protein [Coriobacteriia bacterium]|nr:homocysteine S-methyltransferase family protein [Coriobacteriia bacterium]
MDTFRERLGREVLVLDGAMGTMLQQAGFLAVGAPETLNLIEPDSIARIHSFYRLAGADCVTTNTFGANRSKLAHYNNADLVEQINTAAVRLARQSGAPYVLADMGPTGLILGASANSSDSAEAAEPAAVVEFDQVYEIFYQQAAALAAERPDAFLLETFTDIAELRSAVIACRDADPTLPIIASISLGQSGRMELSGTNPQAAAVILEALRVDAIGLNCSLGPEQMLPLVRQLRAATTLPVLVQPNAGMPTLAADGSTYFPAAPTDFSHFARDMHQAGVAAIGSCCGSTPEFTAAIADEVAGLFCTFDAESVQTSNSVPQLVRIASPQRALTMGAALPLRSIGERINPTGKPVLKQQLLAGSMTMVRELAAAQQAAGVDVLDINVGVAGIDEVTTLKAAVCAVAGAFPLPIAIDTTNPAALEAALKAYPGKALVNSVTGEQKSLDAVLPLVARYGAAVVVLALDEQGIPADAAGRLNIVRRVRDAARERGISDSDVLVDSLVMAAAADKDAARITLQTMQLVQRELGLATILGVSNVSHGLPNRAALNAAFLTAAAQQNLSAAIINPNDSSIADTVATINQTRGDSAADSNVAQITPQIDHSLADFTALLEAAFQPQHVPDDIPPDASEQELPPDQQLVRALVLGDSDAAPRLVDLLLHQGMSVDAVIADILTPTIQDLGARFAEGSVFLPQLMVAAEAMKAAVTCAKTHLPTTNCAEEFDQNSSMQVVFATVKGDIHSIGKDICVSLLESQGIEVCNLGVDVASSQIVAAAREASAVCLSALMTTTLPAMAESVRALRAAYPQLPIVLGGAVVTQQWADSQDAYYEEDAPALALRIVDLLQPSAAK